MARRGVAPRHVAMVEALELRGDERVLEIGCGGGVAATLVGERLTTGTYVGIDRSATQIAAAAKRNAGNRALSFQVATLAGFGGVDGGFDRIFAMHVRALLEPSGGDDLAAVRRLLAPGGSVHLGWEPLPGTAPEVVGEQQAAVLRAHGFGSVAVTVTGRTVVARGA